tara:strand:+ start:86 stop:592 length:507 start_codon:yes stop_codon:yes gene_type:complete
MSDDKDVQVIRVPNTLKKKVGKGRGVKPEMLEEAQRKVDAMKPEYETWSGADLTRLYEIYEKALSDPGQRDHHMTDLFEKAHNMRGDGGSYEYPLVTQIAGSLSSFIEDTEKPDPKDFEVIKAHLDALAVVIGQKMSGDGGAIGKVLVKELETVVKTVEERRKPQSGG